MNNDDIKEIVQNIQTNETNKQSRYSEIAQKAQQFFKTQQTTKFIDLYNEKNFSIREKIDALYIFVMEIIQTENLDYEKILKFREKIVKSQNNNFIYLFDNAMFQAGVNSPEEFVQSIEEGIKKQIPMAYVIKSFFYYYGLEEYFHSMQSIEKAILLEPTNLEYKRLRQNLENEYNGMS